jgi:hypothetical protein
MAGATFPWIPAYAGMTEVGVRHSGACRNPDTTQAEIMEFGIVIATEVLKP